MRADGVAHPGDLCPPTGAFLFWTTNVPYGHAALVTHADPGCDPDRTLVLSNMVLDRQHRASGGAYIVTLNRIESGFVVPDNYLGWTLPRCVISELDTQAGHLAHAPMIGRPLFGENRPSKNLCASETLDERVMGMGLSGRNHGLRRRGRSAVAGDCRRGREHRVKGRVSKSSPAEAAT